MTLKDLIARRGGDVAIQSQLGDDVSRIVKAARWSMSPLCEQLSDEEDRPCSFHITNSLAIEASSCHTSDSQLAVVVSVGLLLRLRLFVSYLLGFGGTPSPVHFVHPEPLEHLDDWDGDCPRLLRPILTEYSRDEDFWVDYRHSQLLIGEIAETDSLTHAQIAAPQIVLQAILFIATHEFCHLREHHHCFIHDTHADRSDDRTRRIIELDADRLAIHAILSSLQATPHFCSGPERSMATLSFQMYGSYALFSMLDARRTVLGSMSDSPLRGLHPVTRSYFLQTFTVEWMQNNRPDLSSRGCVPRSAGLMGGDEFVLGDFLETIYRELANNMASAILALVSRGECTIGTAMRLGGLNLFSNESRVVRKLLVPQAEAELADLRAGLHSMRTELSVYLASHRTACKRSARAAPDASSA